LSPTPHNEPTGSGCRNSMTRSGGTTSNPSGLLRVEASLATNLLAATPTEQVMPCSSWTRSRINWPICRGEPSRRRAPEMSRNASSRLIGSTRGVIEPNSAITPALASLYRRKSGSMTTAWGAARRARAMGIAEWTPNARAS